jgi:transposase
MSPRFVRPYVKSNKNDARDAEAICEAVGRPSMRFVAVKSVAQQDMLALHRVRSLLIRERTALMNQMRGLLAEFGIVVAQGPARLRLALAVIQEERDNGGKRAPTRDAGGDGRAPTVVGAALKALRPEDCHACPR